MSTLVLRGPDLLLGTQPYTAPGPHHPLPANNETTEQQTFEARPIQIITQGLRCSAEREAACARRGI